MFRNIFLAVSAFVFIIILAFISWYGAVFTLEYLIHNNWTILLFSVSILLIALYIIILINDYLVLNNPISLTMIWLKWCKFVNDITKQKLIKWSKKAIIVIISLFLIVGSYSIYKKANQFIIDIQIMQEYKYMYINEHAELEQLRKAFDEMSVDYASVVNTVKHKFYTGAEGNP